MTEQLTIMRAPGTNSYMATYSGDEGSEAHNLAQDGDLHEAIDAALLIWGLSIDDVYIEASN